MAVPTTSGAKTKLQGKIGMLIESTLLGPQLQQLDRKSLLSNNFSICVVPWLVLLLQLQDCLEPGLENLCYSSLSAPQCLLPGLGYVTLVWGHWKKRKEVNSSLVSWYFKLTSSPIYLLLFNFQRLQVANPCILPRFYSCIQRERHGRMCLLQHLELEPKQMLFN